MTKTNKAAAAADAYKSRIAQIRATLDPSCREFATAMSDACCEYETAMVADIGTRRAKALGAGRKSLS